MATPKSERDVLKCGKLGLVQLRRCPVCLFLVMEVTDIVWKRQPIEMSDPGEVAACRYCVRDGRVPTDELPPQPNLKFPHEYRST